MKSYDAIVIGTGGVGSAALFHLARRGLRVLGLDQFPGGHDRGSSHGQTRIIRQAYFEHPDYVPLLLRAYELWRDLEQRCGQQLYHETGLLEIGPPDGVVLPGVLEAARRHDLAVEELSAQDIELRHAGFVVPDECCAVFEQRAGYLRVENCVLAHLEEAQKLGAEAHAPEQVVGWEASGGGVILQTQSHRYSAARLIVAAGAWSSQLLRELGIPLRVVRKHLHWYKTSDDRYAQTSGCPTFFYETKAGYYYGFPQFDNLGVKVAEHSGGDVVSDPTALDCNVDGEERNRVEAFLATHLPGVSRQPTHHQVCMYTLSPDEHFIVDRHPKFPQVAFAAGMSGHGFKFTGVLGDVLADLVIEGKTSQPIDFLRCSRPALQNAQP